MRNRRLTGFVAKASVTVLLAAALAMAVVDVICWRLLAVHSDQAASGDAYGFLLADAALGLRNITSQTYHAELHTKSGRVVYRADYSFDGFGRRVTVADSGSAAD